MKEFAIYTLLRLALFVACFAVVLGVYALVADTVNLLAVLVIAAVLSLALSWKLLARQREQFAASVSARADRAAARFEEIRAKEDAEQ